MPGSSTSTCANPTGTPSARATHKWPRCCASSRSAWLVVSASTDAGAWPARSVAAASSMAGNSRRSLGRALAILYIISAQSSAAARRRAAQDELEKTLQICEGLVRTNPELLERLIEAVHPHGRIAERLCADGIPSSKRREQNLVLCQTQALHA